MPAWYSQSPEEALDLLELEFQSAESHHVGAGKMNLGLLGTQLVFHRCCPIFLKRVCMYVCACVCRYICMCMLVYVCVLCMCICVYVYERGQLWVSSSVVHIIFLRQFLVEPETSWFSLTIWPIPFLPHQHWGYGYTGRTWVELKPSGLLCKHFTNRAISLAPLQFLCFL